MINKSQQVRTSKAIRSFKREQRSFLQKVTTRLADLGYEGLLSQELVTESPDLMLLKTKLEKLLIQLSNSVAAV